MKILGRIVLLVFTFIFGTQTVAFLSWSLPEIPEIVVTDDTRWFEDEKAVAPKNIHVMYAGTEPARSDEIAYLRFVVFNGTPRKLVYASKGAEWPAPEVLVHGQPLPEHYRCGSLTMLYSIEPGASAEFRVGVYEFEEVPKSGALVTVGFYLREENDDFSEAVFSEPFVLPDLFRRSIRLWHKEQETRWR